MDFRTHVFIPPSDLQIDHSSRVMLFGSCFSENIGNLLLENEFDADVNPFGILYNPMSIIAAIRRLWLSERFDEGELTFRNGLYHSFLHHGAFSGPTSEISIRNILDRFVPAADSIRKTDVLLITFGTSYVYRFRESGQIVGNCHKFPSETFTRTRLSVEESSSAWIPLIAEFRETNPDVRFIFTVSPIRHWKDGAHENQLSKAVLHLAIEQISEAYPGNVRYFPAYEILMDELRDYRFYAEDMLHPSSVATQYIWDRFRETFFSHETEKIIAEWQTVYRALSHRPLNPETKEHTAFLTQTLGKLREFSQKYPQVDCEKEIQHINRLVSNDQST
ncbi:MAG: GSCFA domain-containing protein [Petrimonas sp.]|nr:GSCFA domain-containing protein [Petrimonas sp.]